MKKKKEYIYCGKCQVESYVEIKKYTFFRGFFLTLIMAILLMIPILNFGMLYIVWMVGKVYPTKGFWEGEWYDVVKVKVKYE